MKRCQPIVAVLAVFLVIAVPAQEKIPLFTLGISHRAGWIRFGEPSSYYLDGTHYKRLPSSGGGMMWEVYERRVNGLDYEARLLYQIDPNSSRLHPSSRLEEVVFAFDKPIASREALRAIPEAAAACLHTCKLLALDDPGGEHLKVESIQDSDGTPTLELSWFEADGITQRPVASLDDEATEISMYDRSISIQAESAYQKPRHIGRWPELQPAASIK